MQDTRLYLARRSGHHLELMDVSSIPSNAHVTEYPSIHPEDGIAVQELSQEEICEMGGLLPEYDGTRDL